MKFMKRDVKAYKLIALFHKEKKEQMIPISKGQTSLTRNVNERINIVTT